MTTAATTATKVRPNATRSHTARVRPRDPLYRSRSRSRLLEHETQGQEQPNRDHADRWFSDGSQMADLRLRARSSMCGNAARGQVAALATDHLSVAMPLTCVNATVANGLLRQGTRRGRASAWSQAGVEALESGVHSQQVGVLDAQGYSQRESLLDRTHLYVDAEFNLADQVCSAEAGGFGARRVIQVRDQRVGHGLMVPEVEGCPR